MNPQDSPTDATVVTRLRAAGCVFAEEEAALLGAAAASASASASAAELDAMVARRVAGEPLEQVLGWAEFDGLRVLVEPGVFVPRRRSEFLVRVAVQMASAPGAAVPRVIVDLCCGAGALGLAIAAGLFAGRAGGPVAGTELHAADLDPAAVACARRNVEPVGGQVHAGDLFAALPGWLRGEIGVLACNAPYVPTSQIEFLPAEAREHEALMALDGGTDGLAVLRRVAADAAGWLRPGGVLLVETSERQVPAMASAMTGGGLVSQVHEDTERGATVVTGVRTR